VLIFYVEAANYIHIEPLTAKSSAAYLQALIKATAFLNSRHIPVSGFVLDNQISGPVRSFLLDKGTIQLVPPGTHRVNRAERAIRTFKNHFVATLATTHPDFPLHLWDELLVQTEITLNMMRSSAVSNSMSAYQQVCGRYDFNATPIAPLGTKVLVYESAEQRASWAPHGVEAWYVGPALEHYRCFQVWVVSTGRLRTSDSLSWHPTTVLMPGASTLEQLTAILGQLKSTLASLHIAPPQQWFHSSQPLLADVSKDLHDTFSTLAQLFQYGNAPAPELSTPTVINHPPSQRVDPNISRTHSSQQHHIPSAMTEASIQRVPPLNILNGHSPQRVVRLPKAVLSPEPIAIPTDSTAPLLNHGNIPLCDTYLPERKVCPPVRHSLRSHRTPSRFVGIIYQITTI
jgi:hypothetical protein